MLSASYLEHYYDIIRNTLLYLRYATIQLSPFFSMHESAYNIYRFDLDHASEFSFQHGSSEMQLMCFFEN